MLKRFRAQAAKLPLGSLTARQQPFAVSNPASGNSQTMPLLGDPSFGQPSPAQKAYDLYLRDAGVSPSGAQVSGGALVAPETLRGGATTTPAIKPKAVFTAPTLGSIVNPAPARASSPMVASMSEAASAMRRGAARLRAALSYTPGESLRGVTVTPDTSKTPGTLSGAQNMQGGGRSVTAPGFTGSAASRANELASRGQTGTGFSGFSVGGGTAEETAGPTPSASVASRFLEEQGIGAPSRPSTGRVEQRTKDGRYRQDGTWFLPDGTPIGKSSGGDDALAQSLVRELKSYDVTRNDIMEQMQREIDATRDVYAQRLKAAETEGRGRLGSARAIQARGGLLGSDFAGAQTDAVSDYNAGVTSGIQGELDARIAQIMGQGSDRLVAEREARTAALQRGSQAYIDFLAKSDERRATKLREIAGNMVASGLAVDEFSEDQLNSLAKDLGVAPADIRRAYVAADQESKAAAAAARGKATTLSPGEILVDAEGNIIASGADKPGELDQLLTPTEANALGVPFGTTKRQAASMSGDKSGQSSATARQQLETAKAALQNAKDLAYAAGREGSLVEGFRRGAVGATDATRLEAQANTLRTAMLTMATDPSIKKFFGPQMSNLDVQLMTSAGTSLNPALMSPADFEAELTRLEGILNKFDAGAGAAPATPDATIDGVPYRLLPDGTYEEIVFNPAGNASASTADALANAIMQVESGGRQVAGASGEFGAFQFLPATWATVSREMAGQVLPQTPENEFAVARAKIGQLLDTGYSPRDVAAIWNTSLGGSETPRFIRGVNDMGVAYDSIAYADKVMSVLGNIS